jgi:hypothetical protein
MDTGTVIPQILWIPHTVTDRKQHVQDAELQKPIFFYHTDGRLGLTLEAASSGRCNTLMNSQCYAPLGPQTTTQIRIGVSEHSLSALVDSHLLIIPLPFYSGVDTVSLGDRFKSATKRPIAIPSFCQSLPSMWDGPWKHSSRTASLIMKTLPQNGISGEGVFSLTKSLSSGPSRSPLAVGCPFFN